MATATKTPRLLAAAKEFNIGKETLVEFLTGKGFEINASNPNTKITEVMYDALQAEFAQDKLAKRKSEEIALPKGSMLDNIKKNKEELDLGGKEKKEEPVAPVIEEKKKEEKPKEPEAPQPVVEAVKEEVKPEALPEPAEPAQEKPVKKAAKKEEVKEEQPEPEVRKEAPETPSEQNDEEGHIEVKAPKLEGPNVLGKIISKR